MIAAFKICGEAWPRWLEGDNLVSSAKGKGQRLQGKLKYVDLRMRVFL